MSKKSKTVGIRLLKDRLSAYVRSISETGEEVVITDRGRAVARLVGMEGRDLERRPPMRIRHAVKDHSDLSWMKRRPAAREASARASDISSAIDFIRGDKDVL